LGVKNGEVARQTRRARYKRKDPSEEAGASD
jgi:hypothetical protein